MATASPSAWPELPYGAWKETCTTLHLWTQVVGKVRLACTPWLNHSWHVPLYVTARGLTTSLVPYGRESFAIDFDFVAQELVLAVTDGRGQRLPLREQSVAVFYSALLSSLRDLGFAVELFETPCEIPDAIPFGADHAHRAYDPDAARRFWRALTDMQRVLESFRTSFLGKCSPVHFFWGSFDLAVTRFSGRRAPVHPGVVPHLPGAVLREAYSHEVSSAGFWPGGNGFESAAFYSYAYPEPEGFRDAPVQPDAAFYSTALSEFLLPYDAVRRAVDPERELMAFLRSTYAAAAQQGGWDRAALECAPGEPRVPRAIA